MRSEIWKYEDTTSIRVAVQLGQQSNQPLAKYKERIKKEIKENSKTLKKERRLLKNYLWFFRQTLPLEEIKCGTEIIDQKRTTEVELKEQKIKKK